MRRQAIRSSAEVRGLAACCVALALVVAAALGAAAGRSRADAGARDDTAWLQAALDRGSRVFLPKLPDGECYRTRGLWVSVSGTRIASNGACVEYLGPGPARLTSSDGDPIAADAVFFVNRSSRKAAAPRSVVISDLTLLVPVGTEGYGVLVAGEHVTLADLDIDGVPLDGITITGRQSGLPYAGPVTIDSSRIRAALRNGISIVDAVGVTIDSNTITGAGLVGVANSQRGPWAGIDIEPDSASYPIKAVRITRNMISGNGGAGVLLALKAPDGLPGTADQISLSANTITGNGAGGGSSPHGGVCLQGGQSDGRGRLNLTGNEIVGNGGWGLCTQGPLAGMEITLACNQVSDNAAGDSQWGALAGVSADETDSASGGRAGCG